MHWLKSFEFEKSSSTSFHSKLNPSLLSCTGSVLTLSQKTWRQSIPPSLDSNNSKFFFFFLKFVDHITEVYFLKLLKIYLSFSRCNQNKFVPIT